MEKQVKKLVNFRLSLEGIATLEGLKAEMGCSQADVVEAALSHFHESYSKQVRDDGIELEPVAREKKAKRTPLPAIEIPRAEVSSKATIELPEKKPADMTWAQWDTMQRKAGVRPVEDPLADWRASRKPLMKGGKG